MVGSGCPTSHTSVSFLRVMEVFLFFGSGSSIWTKASYNFTGSKMKMHTQFEIVKLFIV